MSSPRRCLVGLVLAASCAGAPPPAAAPAGGDRSTDFDFHTGTWHTAISRLKAPLSGTTTWVKYEGTTVVRPIWNGAGNLVELIADGPAGHLELLSLRLYDPEARRWSMYVGSRRSGELSPPVVGQFRDGRGEFLGQETMDGKPILVRFVVSDITPTSCRFEQAFSADGGKTWELNWVAVDTRT